MYNSQNAGLKVWKTITNNGKCYHGYKCEKKAEWAIQQKLPRMSADKMDPPIYCCLEDAIAAVESVRWR